MKWCVSLNYFLRVKSYLNRVKSGELRVEIWYRLEETLHTVILSVAEGSRRSRITFPSWGKVI
jgi:hypothetical protein